jgi:phage tail sheath protein FI
MTTNVNMIAAPGIRETLITDYIALRLPSYALAMYVMDIPSYSDTNVRVFDGSGLKPNVTKTADALTVRSPDTNYVATYFPDVYVNDTTTGARVKVPSSVAALGALAYGDKVAYPWYAPAGFNRAALDFVSNVDVRLSTSDRDYLYENRINPIATFPGSGFVIFGQKTLQVSKSAFDRVNVRRLFLELKRVIQSVARGLLFEPNDATTRAAFVSRATPLLSLIKAQAGVDQFKIICDETNNTQADIEASRLNGKIIVVPTRAVEFIAVDFIITPAGVEFV